MDAAHGIEHCQRVERRHATAMIDTVRAVQADPLADLPRGDVEEIAGGAMGFGGPDVWWSQAIGLGLPTPPPPDDGHDDRHPGLPRLAGSTRSGRVRDDDFDRLIAFYQERGGTPTVCAPSYAHASLFHGLMTRGFVVDEIEHVFARHLPPGLDLTALARFPAPSNLAFRKVKPDDERAIAAAAEVVADANPTAADSYRKTMPATARAIAGGALATLLLAYLDGEAVEPIGYCGMDTCKGDTHLFAGTVAEPYRRRGVQTAMVLERIRRGIAAGATYVTTAGVPGGPTERTVTRLGFSIAYTNIQFVRP